MGQIPLTNQERIEAIRRFGYTEREAAFLCLAALHGGYFLRRQYVQFLEKAVGGTAAVLIEKVLANEHANASTYAENTHIYHVCSRPFYAALGQGDNRNRRDRQPLTIKNKLMGLDFVLAHPGHGYLATEQEKVDYFADTLNVNLQALPIKLYHGENGGQPTARYFVDKFPIYTSPTQQGDGSEVCFCYVDAGATTVSGFETYLEHYRPLFTSLPRFRVVYVAARPLLFKAAERTFQRFVRQSASETDHRDAAPATDLLDYFEARNLYECGDLASFDRVKLIRLRDQRRQFSSEEHEALYQQWRTERERRASDVSRANPGTSTLLPGAFSVCLLAHNYDLFGTLTSF